MSTTENVKVESNRRGLLLIDAREVAPDWISANELSGGSWKPGNYRIRSPSATSRSVGGRRTSGPGWRRDAPSARMGGPRK